MNGEETWKIEPDGDQQFKKHVINLIRKKSTHMKKGRRREREAQHVRIIDMMNSIIYIV